VCPLAFWFKDKEIALGRVDKARVSRGGIRRHRRVPVHERWSSGRIPADLVLAVASSRSLVRVSTAGCRYFQELVEIGFFFLTWGWWRKTSGDGWRQRSLDDSAE